MRSYLLLVLLFLVNCDMSTSTSYEQKKLTLYLLTINNSTTINNSSGSKPSYPSGDSGGTFLASCGLECLDTIGEKFFFNDDYPGTNSCGLHSWSSGNNNKRPEPGERGILQIPLIYYGTNPFSRIYAELISDDNRIRIVEYTTKLYPELSRPNGKDSYYTCANAYYEEWGIYNPSSVCNTDDRHRCLGWKIEIPQDYIGYVSFKLLISTNIGTKVLRYRL